MSSTTIRVFIALFLIAHGYIHFSLTKVPVPATGAMRTPFWPGWWRKDVDPLWLASRMGLPETVVRIAGSMLWLATLLGFTLAGLGILGVPGLNAIWQGMAIGGSIASLLLLGFYWHPWLVAGVLIDLAVFVSLGLHWPALLFQNQ